MSSVSPVASTLQRPLRLWPGVLFVALQWLLRFVVPLFVVGAMPYAMMGGLAGGFLVLLWWACFSRAPSGERWGLLLLSIAAIVGTSLAAHKSVAESMRGIMILIYIMPPLSLGIVLWAVFGRRLAGASRYLALCAVLLLSCGMWTLVRTSGVTGSAGAQFSWRWTASPEELLLSSGEEALPLDGATRVLDPVEASDPRGTKSEPEWPGFRGPQRDGIVRGPAQARLQTDWEASPPLLLWRRPVGPGWSSFAVDGDRFYTQEQRGEEELVSCYSVSSGAPLWRHRDPVRFWESMAGAGPRGTPSLKHGRLYSLGATGVLNALDALDGSLLWSRDVALDTGQEIPEWGYSSSPLVLEETLIVAVGGELAAYGLLDGEPRWSGPAAAGSYSSPHLMTLDGVEQIVLLHEAGAMAVTPLDGTLLWEHAWPGSPIVQPALTEDGGLLISAGDTSGLRRLALVRGRDAWSVELDWRSVRLKPWFNDFVIHAGHAFGFDGSVLACIDVRDGKRKWKGGRFGNGQLVLLAEQELLLVLSEAGELVLVSATPEAFGELGRIAGIEGKTWNHPALVDGVLLIRNDQEMAAFRLPLVDG